MLIVEGLVAGIAVITLAPLADYLVDPSLEKPGSITIYLVETIRPLGIEPGFVFFAGFFVIINLFKSFLDVGTRFTILVIKYRVVRRLISDTLKVFFEARLSFFIGTAQGKLLNTFTHELGKIGDALGHITTQFAQILQLIIYLSLPLWINLQMTISAIGIAAGFSILFLLLHRISYRLGQLNTQTGNEAMGVLTESLGAARLILGFARQPQTISRYLNAFDKHISAALRSQTLSAAIPALFQPVGIFAGVMAMGIAFQEGLPMSETATVLWSLLRAMPIVGSLLRTNISISNFLPSYEQLESLRDDAIRNFERHGDRVSEGLNASVVFKEVSFSYPKRNITLDDVNMEICIGSMTALVGESGSGKSTIADLLLGLQVPDKGTLFLEGIPQNEWNMNSFREHIGYVPQEPQLFNYSIRDNLLWACEEAVEEELWNACRLSNCYELIKQLPGGLDTVVGDRGVMLSGGQRQRIALARALLRKPKLLILDEATSSLDSKSERLIQTSIDKITERETTVFVIAHRLSTVVKANRIYVLKNGSIAESGTYKELFANPTGIFTKMVESQTIVA